MTHDEDVVVVNTNESLVRLFKQSASHAWSVDPERVKQTKLLVCVHNTPHLPLHNTVFAIGKVLPDGVMPVEGEPDRTIIGVSAFALVDNVYCPIKWNMGRRELRYVSRTELAEWGVDVDALVWWKRARTRSPSSIPSRA
jgi:hypothetical protein